MQFPKPHRKDCRVNPGTAWAGESGQDAGGGGARGRGLLPCVEGREGTGEKKTTGTDGE